VVLIMSNGGFDNIHERLLAALRERAGRASAAPDSGRPDSAQPAAATAASRAGTPR
jgi:hypothetical protein